jgi:hypothetical protein
MTAVIVIVFAPMAAPGPVGTYMVSGASCGVPISSHLATPAACIWPSALTSRPGCMVVVRAWGGLTKTMVSCHCHYLVTTRAPGPIGIHMAGFSSSSNAGVTPGLDEEAVR